MKNTELIYTAAQYPELAFELENTSGVCAVCGSEIFEGIPIKKVVSNAFTDWNSLADISSPYVCKACAWCIKEPKMRRSQYIATTKHLIYFKREDIEKYLFTPPQQPFVLFVTASYKKHGSFKAKVNNSTNLFYVQFEDQSVLFSPNKYKNLWDVMNRMYVVFNKTQEIGKGIYIQKRVREYGIEQWKLDEELLARHRSSQQFELLLYALNKPEVE